MSFPSWVSTPFNTRADKETRNHKQVHHAIANSYRNTHSLFLWAYFYKNSTPVVSEVWGGGGGDKEHMLCPSVVWTKCLGMHVYTKKRFWLIMLHPLPWWFFPNNKLSVNGVHAKKRKCTLSALSSFICGHKKSWNLRLIRLWSLCRKEKKNK